VLIDPNTLSTDGTVALGPIAFSDDGKYMAYAISAAGSIGRSGACAMSQPARICPI